MNEIDKKFLFEMMEKLNPDIQKKRITESEIERDIEFGEENLLNNVKFFGDCRMIDVGIGSHEFWGSPGFDSKMVPECKNIQWNNEDFTDEQNAVIKNYLENNYDEIQEEIEQNYEDAGGDEGYR